MNGQKRIKVSIIGASGYVGGELLRLLLQHPYVDPVQVTSRKYLGKYVYTVHPNLRNLTNLKFSSPENLKEVDVMFLCLPHGESQKKIEEFSKYAAKIIDTGADFRLRNPDMYRKWYGMEHTSPEWLKKFVYGLPELYREEIRNENYVSGVGCNATVSTFAILPLFKSGIVDTEKDIVIEVKVGSSEGGAKARQDSHHPERSHAVRSFAPVSHRHTAEIIQNISRYSNNPRIHLSVTGVELVRGALATAHIFVKEEIDEKDLWKIYRETYKDEPFVRLVVSKTGIYRYPEPKILWGTNFVDVGFAYKKETGRVVSIAAIDNLMKGAAGTAVQCMNLMFGFDEKIGLEFTGLHPV